MGVGGGGTKPHKLSYRCYSSQSLDSQVVVGMLVTTQRTPGGTQAGRFRIMVFRIPIYSKTAFQLGIL